MNGISKLLSLKCCSSFEVHLKKLDQIRKDLEVKKQKKLQLIDMRQEEIVMRTNNNKRRAQIFKEYERLIEVQRTNNSLLRKIEDISQRSNTQKLAVTAIIL